MGRRWTDPKPGQALALLVALVLVSGGLGWLAATLAADEQPPGMLVCSEDAHSAQRRCPPEVDVPVLGYWNDGSSATVRWDGRAWRLVIPGGRGAVVNYPQTWRDPASE